MLKVRTEAAVARNSEERMAAAVDFDPHDPRGDALYRTVFENTNTALLVMEADTTVAMVNRQFEELSGYPRQAIEGKMQWTRFVHPDDRERMKAYHYRRRQEDTGPPNVYEFRFVNADGETRHILLRVSMIPGTDQSIGSLIDITPRKEAEKAVQASEKKYRTILDSIDEGYCELDLKGNLTFVNDPMCKITGFDREALLEMNNREYACEETAREMYTVFNEVFRTGKPSRVSRFQVGKDGRNAHLEMVVSLAKDENGNPVGFRGLVRDVTERAKTEAKRIEFERLQGVLEMAGAVCHELNQPLQSIMGYSQLLQLDVPEGFAGADYLKKIVNQVERMKEIAGKLMGITRYETVEYLNGSKIIDIERSSIKEHKIK